MIVSTPYTECWIKKSFLSGAPVLGKDETLFGIMIAIRFTRGRAPLYICYIPSVGAVYDKVDQCAIFNREDVPDEEIGMADVGWWDAISTDWQLIQIQAIQTMDVEATMRTGREVFGSYLWTCDPIKPEGTDYGQSVIWHEHKTKTYFFDQETGVLCCAPNNKMRWYDSSLSPDELESPDFLRVYKDADYPDRTSHEQVGYFGDTNDSFTYQK